MYVVYPATPLTSNAASPRPASIPPLLHVTKVSPRKELSLKKNKNKNKRPHQNFEIEKDVEVSRFFDRWQRGNVALVVPRQRLQHLVEIAIVPVARQRTSLHRRRRRRLQHCQHEHFVHQPSNDPNNNKKIYIYIKLKQKPNE